MGKIEELYDNFDEENRLLRSRESQVESQTTVKYLAPYMKSKKVLEVGCGTGFYALTFKDVFSSYTGIDISSRNVKVFNETISKAGAKKIKAKLGDALKIDEPDESFDVVLNLGPLYHLNKKDQQKAINESIRVCKKGGIIAFAYMNKFGNFVKLCSQEIFIGRYPTKKLLDCMMKKDTDDDNVFFFTTPEDIEKVLTNSGLAIEHHLSTDGVTMHHHRIADFRDEEFQIWLNFHLATCEEPSIRGMGDHGLVICKKN